MTYGVPYSFVPGTKAKADEVNANFNDILQKLETTNSRIDSTNSSLTASNSKIETVDKTVKENKNLLDDNVRKLNESINSKPNHGDIDGFWTTQQVIIAEHVIIQFGSSVTYNLSNFLPRDNNVYEVFINIILDTAPGADILFISQIGTDYFETECLRLNTLGGSGNFILPVGASRNITISCKFQPASPRKMFIFMKGYRKVR